MSILKALRAATTLDEVAILLGFKASALSYILYIKSPESKYRRFDIPKRYGGTRQICAPCDELRLLQRRLSDLLHNCVTEISAFNGYENKFSHGFERQRSIITNAVNHRNRRYVFNIDLKDFFGTINFGRVRGYFISDRNFALHEKAATIIAQIACFEHQLPQGSPCSPIISNLIGHLLDVHLVQMAARAGCTYTRYADDLTFSTNKKDFPKRIAQQTGDELHRWVAGKELSRLVRKSGFQLNVDKTRMQYWDSRQEVTGLVVNRKLNIPCEYRHKVRAMVHRLFTTGSFDFENTVLEPSGKFSLLKKTGRISQLHGMLGFIDAIDIFNKRRINDLLHEKIRLNSKEAMYRRFLLYKEFYAAERPVIVCEGKTDNIYLVHAIRRLAPTYPDLAEIQQDGSIKLKVRLFKYVDSSTGRILGITGGAPCLKNFIFTYKAEIARFHAPGKQHPVILLIDNDSAASQILNAITGITKKKAERTEPFIHVAANLYVVPTPLLGNVNDSMIEDFFDDEIKNTVVSGKTFHLGKDKDADTDLHYGKVVFAHKVVRPKADTIDFSRFQNILSNIASVIDSHSKLYSA